MNRKTINSLPENFRKDAKHIMKVESGGQMPDKNYFEAIDRLELASIQHAIEKNYITRSPRINEEIKETIENLSLFLKQEFPDEAGQKMGQSLRLHRAMSFFGQDEKWTDSLILATLLYPCCASKRFKKSCRQVHGRDVHDFIFSLPSWEKFRLKKCRTEEEWQKHTDSYLKAVLKAPTASILIFFADQIDILRSLSWNHQFSKAEVWQKMGLDKEDHFWFNKKTIDFFMKLSADSHVFEILAEFKKLFENTAASLKWRNVQV